MAKLFSLLSATTEDYEKINSEGKQYTNTGYPNRIKLRDESRTNMLENLEKKVIESKNNDTKEATATAEATYTLNQVGQNFSQVEPGKAIRLTSEKLENLENRLVEQNYNQTDATITADADLTPTMENTTSNSEEIAIANNNSNVEPIVNDSETVVETNTSDEKEENVVEPIESSQIDKVYQEIIKETEDTLKAKADADKAKADVEEAERHSQEKIEEAERKAQEKIEESDKKLLELSAEKAEIQARKAEALAKREQVEKDIIKMLGSQRATLGKSKQQYLQQQDESKARLQQLNEQTKKQTDEINKKAEIKTAENNAKILEFQKANELERSDLTQVEDEIARKEAILAALSNSVGFNSISESTDNNINENAEPTVSYQKVA